MPASQVVRRSAFAEWVRRAVANAQVRGLSIPQIAERAGISNSTIYRWINNTGAGAKMPSPDQLVAFCDVLELDPAVPFRQLWPGKVADQPRPPEPELDPVIVAIARKLEDPNLPEQEKYHLRETLSQLAARPAQPATSRVVRRARR